MRDQLHTFGYICDHLLNKFELKRCFAMEKPLKFCVLCFMICRTLLVQFGSDKISPQLIHFNTISFPKIHSCWIHSYFIFCIILLWSSNILRLLWFMLHKWDAKDSQDWFLTFIVDEFVVHFDNKTCLKSFCCFSTLLFGSTVGSGSKRQKVGAKSAVFRKAN